MNRFIFLILALSIGIFSISGEGQEKPKTTAYSPERVAEVLAEAKANGDVRRGAQVFRAPQFACLGCHKVGGEGGIVGPDLSKVGTCLTPEQIVESILWPKREVKDEYKALSIVTTAGKIIQGYKERENDKELVLRDPATGQQILLRKADIDERREVGSLMPEGLAAAMTPEQLQDLVRFLLELGHTEHLADLVHPHVAAKMPPDRMPLNPKHWPNWQKPVNRDRQYDFYGHEAEYFMKQPRVPFLLPEYPGLDGPRHGHWGNQTEDIWKDNRWNKTDLGNVLCGVFHGPGVTVPRGVCVRLGEHGEMAACFNPETLTYDSLWQDGFLKFSDVRHGFMHGLIMNGKPLPRPDGKKPDRPFVYHGFYRHGQRVIFSYTLDGVKMLDAPWVEDGKFTRVVAPADKHPLAKLTHGGPAQWPNRLPTRGTLGTGMPYAIDTIEPPFENPWNALLFFGDLAFLPDGSALLCTMQGDVWHVDGLDDKLAKITWRRIASGLHQALGMVVIPSQNEKVSGFAGAQVYVLGRDQITRLHDLNGDGEVDFHECFSNAYITPAGGHDFTCGLQIDPAGNFYTASSRQGLVRISADGKKADSLATGFRNPDGLGIYPDGALTVPCSEGDWTPASMLCLVRPGVKATPALIGGHTPPYFGYGGPRNGRPPDLPFVYLPRGVDNSSGGQAFIAGDKWGPLKGHMVHFSYGTCAHFLLLRDEVDGQPQGTVVPLPGEFASGAHRGRFHPKDGQLYVAGMGGWGTYALTDGSFQRVRYTGADVQLPIACRVHENGVQVTFSRPVDRETALNPKNHFAQVWNYRYGLQYGSPEFSPHHPGTVGHDYMPISSVHLSGDGRNVFLAMADLQPVNQLHLRLRVGSGSGQDLFATVHKLAAPFTDLPDYKPVKRTIAAHPILVDLRASAKAAPNPWKSTIAGAKALTIEADKNLTFVQKTLPVKAGEAVKLTFVNPDSVPHNWVLIKPGTLESVGTLANQIIADPDAASKQYVPTSPNVLHYTDVVPGQGRFTIYFQAPMQKGRYPYLCTFPGHWMVMNGQMVVE